MAEDPTLPSRDVLEHVVDVHCHPTEELDIPDDALRELPLKICPMAWSRESQERVAQLAARCPDQVIPGFGFHPWVYHEISLAHPAPGKEEHYRGLFSQKAKSAQKEEELSTLIVSLPEPMSLKDMLASVRSSLLAHPNAILGEVGLDRSYRIKYQPSDPKRLSPFSTPVEHQRAILEAQLELAVELRRNVSLHSVTAQQITIDILLAMKKKHGKAWTDISIDLHSCGLSVDGWKVLEKSGRNIFLSLSPVVNFRSDRHVPLIEQCAEDRILAESDYSDIRKCGSETWKMLEAIARIKRWPLETSWEATEPQEEDWGVVRRLERNFKRFVAGGHGEDAPPKSRRLRRQHEHYPSDASEDE